MGRHGQGREERHIDGKGRARAGAGNSIWQGRVGNSRTSVRGTVVQRSKIEYSRHHDTLNGLRK